jgi:hypothetical protein
MKPTTPTPQKTANEAMLALEEVTIAIAERGVLSPTDWMRENKALRLQMEGYGFSILHANQSDVRAALMDFLAIRQAEYAVALGKENLGWSAQRRGEALSLMQRAENALSFYVEDVGESDVEALPALREFLADELEEAAVDWCGFGVDDIIEIAEAENALVLSEAEAVAVIALLSNKGEIGTGNPRDQIAYWVKQSGRGTSTQEVA